MFRRDFLTLVLPEETEHFRICADYYIVRICHAFCTTFFVRYIGGAYRLHGSNGFSQSSLISADQQAADFPRFGWQKREAEQVAGEVIAQRYQQFAVAFGDFHVARALLSLSRRARPHVFRLLLQRQSFFAASALTLMARLSLRIGRTRTLCRSVGRVFWSGR